MQVLLFNTMKGIIEAKAKAFEVGIIFAKEVGIIIIIIFIENMNFSFNWKRDTTRKANK